jgi:hypothetical protein
MNHGADLIVLNGVPEGGGGRLDTTMMGILLGLPGCEFHICTTII